MRHGRKNCWQPTIASSIVGMLHRNAISQNANINPTLHRRRSIAKPLIRVNPRIAFHILFEFHSHTNTPTAWRNFHRINQTAAAAATAVVAVTHLLLSLISDACFNHPHDMKKLSSWHGRSQGVYAPSPGQ